MKALLALAAFLASSASMAAEKVSLAGEFSRAQGVVNRHAVRRAARLCYPEAEILAHVAAAMGIALRPDQPLPRLRYESQTPLKEFQDALEKQWRERPPIFSNAYAEASNTIYLIDEPGYYARLRRWIDDSLAHEYVHYLRVRYSGWKLHPDDDPAEMEAVQFQTMFRESRMESAEGRRRCAGPRPAM